MKMIIYVFVLMSILGNVFAQPIQPCQAEQCRQFDFWLGTWELTWSDTSGTEKKGTNSVSSILNGCVIQEQFDGNPAMNFKGLSVSVYNVRRGIWQQTWVDNNGAYLEFTGGMQDGVMTLSREAEYKGQKVMQRMRFYNIKKESMDWAWEGSRDGGKSWQTNWLIHYKRKK